MFSILDINPTYGKRFMQLLEDHKINLTDEQIDEIRYRYLDIKFIPTKTRAVSKKQLNDFQKLLKEQREYMTRYNGGTEERIYLDSLAPITQLKICFGNKDYNFDDPRLLQHFRTYLNLMLKDFDLGKVKPEPSAQHEFRHLVKPIFEYLVNLANNGQIGLSKNAIHDFIFDLMQIVFPKSFLPGNYELESDYKNYKVARIKRIISDKIDI
jgi:hypothetical protein